MDRIEYDLAVMALTQLSRAVQQGWYWGKVECRLEALYDEKSGGALMCEENLAKDPILIRFTFTISSDNESHSEVLTLRHESGPHLKGKWFLPRYYGDGVSAMAKRIRKILNKVATPAKSVRMYYSGGLLLSGPGYYNSEPCGGYWADRNSMREKLKRFMR